MVYCQVYIYLDLAWSVYTLRRYSVAVRAVESIELDNCKRSPDSQGLYKLIKVHDCCAIRMTAMQYELHILSL